MTDPFVQRFDEEAREDEQDRLRARRERIDRRLDYTPVAPCRECGEMAVEVAPSEWQCGCDRRAA